jgi:hypothetical protein
MIKIRVHFDKGLHWKIWRFTQIHHFWGYFKILTLGKGTLTICLYETSKNILLQMIVIKEDRLSM